MRCLLLLVLGAVLAGCGDGGGRKPASAEWPPAMDHALSTMEDTILKGSLPLAISPNGGSVRYALIPIVSKGKVEVRKDGTFTYTPPADFTGTDTFRYRVRDDWGIGPTYTVHVSVEPVNDAPRLKEGPAPGIPVSSPGAAIFPGSGEGNAVALDAAGRVHVAGNVRRGGRHEFAVARYTADGLLDLGYGGGDGIATASMGTVDASACRIVIDGSGRSVVAVRSETDGQAVLALARFTAVGALDSGFGGGSGVVSTSIGSAPLPDFAAPAVFGLALDGSGRILVGGSSTVGAREVLTVARYSAEGVLDASFGSGGQVTVEIGTSSSGARDIAVDQSGRIVVAGFSHVPSPWGETFNGAITIARLTDDGVLDADFGDGDGVVTTSIPYSTLGPSAMALDDAGRIIVAGYKFGAGPMWDMLEPIVVRFTADGVLDASFGGGIVDVSFGEPGAWSSTADVVVDSSGNILVAGTSWGYVRPLFAVMRYTDSGMRDWNFGNGTGIVTIYSGSGAEGNGIGLDSAGRLLVTGTVQTGSHNAMAIARYSGEGVLDQGFNASGDGTFWFPVDSRFYDVDGDVLTYTVALADGSPLPPGLHFDDELSLAGNPPADAMTIVVTATDPEGLWAQESYEFLRLSPE